MQTVDLTKKQGEVLIRLAFAFGYRSMWSSLEQALKEHNHEQYPSCHLSKEPGYISFSGSSSDGCSFAEAVEAMREPSPRVNLNADYSATREGDFIVVGCQKIPVEKAKEVYEKLCE